MSCRAFPPRPPWHNPTATKEHMPFKGHRTVAQVWAQQEAAYKRSRDWGYEIEAAE